MITVFITLKNKDDECLRGHNKNFQFLFCFWCTLTATSAKENQTIPKAYTHKIHFKQDYVNESPAGADMGFNQHRENWFHFNEGLEFALTRLKKQVMLSCMK